MTRRLGQVLALGGMLSMLASCGGSSSGSVSGGAPGFYISITNMAFSPAELDVPPGATVTVIDNDTMPHSVTSETAPNVFTLGAVAGVQFDTGSFSGTTTFTIPAAAPNGTVVPYFCTIHRAAMATPNATIKIDDTAQPGPAPGSGGGRSGGY